MVPSQIGCPVCRDEMGVDVRDLESRSEVTKVNRSEVRLPFVMDEAFLASQAERLRVFEMQKQKGGVIDVEADEQRLHLSNVPYHYNCGPFLSSSLFFNVQTLQLLHCRQPSTCQMLPLKNRKLKKIYRRRTAVESVRKIKSRCLAQVVASQRSRLRVVVSQNRMDVWEGIVTFRLEQTMTRK